MASAICWLLLNVCIRRPTAWSCVRICMNRWVYLLVRTRSFAMTLHAFCGGTDISASAAQSTAQDSGIAHQLAGLGAALDVADELLLLLLELGALAVELALRLREGALVLPQPFRGGHCPPEERFLWQ